MRTIVVSIPTDIITSWDSFHSVFQDAFGFLSGYGHNMDAWIDCMSYLGENDSGMTGLDLSPGEIAAIRIDKADDFQRRCPEQYSFLVEGTAIVNHRRVSQGEPPILALLLSGHL